MDTKKLDALYVELFLVFNMIETLQLYYVYSFFAFWALLDLELNRTAFFQRLVAVARDSIEMYEYIVA